MEAADKAAASSESAGRASAPDALAKALTYAALKLDRAAEENARLRKALDDLRRRSRT